MPLPVNSTTAKKSKAVKVDFETWTVLSHESTRTETPLMKLVAVACRQFMQFPEGKRDKMIREFDGAAAA